MARSSIKYIDAASMYEQEKVGVKTTNPVVYGRFPKRIQINDVSPVEKFNRLLISVLMCLVMMSLVSYYFVSDNQRIMNDLGRQIVALNNENIELQNKLDNLNSFNKVDAVIQGKTSLDTAKKVIEIPAVNAVSTRTKKFPSIPVNYNWSVGY